MADFSGQTVIRCTKSSRLKAAGRWLAACMVLAFNNSPLNPFDRSSKVVECVGKNIRRSQKKKRLIRRRMNLVQG